MGQIKKKSMQKITNANELNCITELQYLYLLSAIILKIRSTKKHGGLKYSI